MEEIKYFIKNKFIFCNFKFINMIKIQKNFFLKKNKTNNINNKRIIIFF